MNSIKRLIKNFLILIFCLFIPFPAIAAIPQELWDEAKPFFLPNDHPIKNQLDALFTQGPLLDSFEEMEKAGFTLFNANSELDVAIHPNLPGYVVKFYLNTHDNQPRFTKLKLKDAYISEARLWLLRIYGAKRIQNILDEHQYHHIMKVPKIWIYPLPLASASSKPFPKNFILIEENMNIVDDEENTKNYREKMSPFLLKALYTVLKESGFYDSVYIDNNPFSGDGRIAFVDTEEYDLKPVPFEKLTKHFSPEMQVYWHQLMAEEHPN